MKFYAYCALSCVVLTIVACNSQTPTGVSAEKAVAHTAPAAQIGRYISNIFEDSKGSLWFSTLGSGVAKYDGATLSYLTTAEGLIGNNVIGIAEDEAGIIWLATQSGLSRYDGNTIANFDRPGFDADHNRISSLYIDRQGRMWVGTWADICLFDGQNFNKFLIPKPEVALYHYQQTMNWSTEITEDRLGNIWFARDGYGACKYDGVTFTHYTKETGLPSNNVHDVVMDKLGHLWFATRVVERDHPNPDMRFGNGGLSRFDGETFTDYPALAGLSKQDVYNIYEDRNNNLWITTIRDGVYKFDGEQFINYQPPVSIENAAFTGVTGILEDRNGNLWFGCGSGLFRLKNDTLINVTQNGPWP